MNSNMDGLRIHVMSALVSARLSSSKKLHGKMDTSNPALMQDFRTTADWSTNVVALISAPWLKDTATDTVIGEIEDDNNVSRPSYASVETTSSSTSTSRANDDDDDDELERLDGIAIITEDSMYECVPRSLLHLKEEFYRLVTDPTGNHERQGEMLAQSLGLNVLSMYEQAADRVLRRATRCRAMSSSTDSTATATPTSSITSPKSSTRRGRSSRRATALALHLYAQSDATPTKIVRELVRARRPLAAATYGRQYLERMTKEEEEGEHGSTTSEYMVEKRGKIAYRVVQCYVGASGESSCVDNQPEEDKEDEEENKEKNRKETMSKETFYIPTGVSCIADPHAHPALLHFLETTDDYPLKRTTELLIENGLVGAALVASHRQRQIAYGIQLLLLPTSPRVGTAEIDFLTATNHTADLCAVGQGALVRTLSLPLQIRFLSHVASTSPHLLVDFVSLVLGLLPRMGKQHLSNFQVALEKGVSSIDMMSFGTLASFKLGELIATVLLYIIHYETNEGGAGAVGGGGGDSDSDSGGEGTAGEKARRKLMSLLKDTKALPVRTDIIAARCADFGCWDLAAAAFEAQKRWLQVLCCRLMHVNLYSSQKSSQPAQRPQATDHHHHHSATQQNVETGEDPVDNMVFKVLEEILKQAHVKTHASLWSYFLKQWAANSRSSLALEHFLYPMLQTTHGAIISSTMFHLERTIYKSLKLSASFCFTLAKIQLREKSSSIEMGSSSSSERYARGDTGGSMGSSGSQRGRSHEVGRAGSEIGRRSSFKHTQQMWSEIRTNLDNVSFKQDRSISVSADMLLSCSGGDGGAIVFTCGHIFDATTFYNQLLPKFEKQLQERLNSSIPVTLHAIIEEYKRGDIIHLPCPKCLFRKLVQEM